ncbi:MAG: hypothetical protein K5662_07205 [Lachnospiraceae bacterium]|nr:hypothetical protein [Lachnospiraceae bacterium]
MFDDYDDLDDLDSIDDDYLWDKEHGFINDDVEYENCGDIVNEILLGLDEVDIWLLEASGIDILEYEEMDDDQKRRALRKANLDPNDFGI